MAPYFSRIRGEFGTMYHCVRRLAILHITTAVLLTASTAEAGTGVLKLTVVDHETGEPIPCRIHLRNSHGVARTVPGLPFWHDHFAFPGTVELELNRGAYTFLVERGPEYVHVRGHFTINDYAQDEKVVHLKRAVDMAAENWWAGDLHVERPLREIELAMRAENLHVASVITWTDEKNPWDGKRQPEQTVVQFDGNRFYDLMAGRDQRGGGGAMLLSNLDSPLDLAGATRDHPSAAEFLLAARERNSSAWVDAARPFAWDLPIWLAAGQVDSIGLAHDHMQREGMQRGKLAGRAPLPRDYPGPMATAHWSEAIYYHVLNSGLRIPPSAGSGSGQSPNPMGYNRVYVWVDKDRFNYQTWLEGFRQGRVVVTNGPLLRPLANGRLPGSVFQAAAGESVNIDLTMSLSTRDPINYLEVIHNGRVLQSVRLADYAKNGGRLPPLTIQESGWFLVRAVADVGSTYRFASTGPWYVEFDERPRVSRASVQFFADWVEQRAAQIKLTDPQQQQAAMYWIDQARAFWSDRVQQATAE